MMRVELNVSVPSTGGTREIATVRIIFRVFAPIAVRVSRPTALDVAQEWDVGTPYVYPHDHLEIV